PRVARVNGGGGLGNGNCIIFRICEALPGVTYTITALSAYNITSCTGTPSLCGTTGCGTASFTF
ncbi:MAG: hypothetical protein ABI778_07540, partial [Ignavibacteriota bacterium]